MKQIKTGPERMQLTILGMVFLMGMIISCNKIRELNQEPEIQSLRDGLKTSAVIGYCASLSYTLFRGNPLPDNVVFNSISSEYNSRSGILMVKIDEEYPLLFHDNVGEIFIAGTWNENNDGVISILLSDFNLSGNYVAYLGIHTIPVIYQDDTGNILTLMAGQDIVVGQGSDTLLNLSFSKMQFDIEISRVEEEKPSDLFAAVKQNVWFVEIDQNETPSNLYDDQYLLNGGGQIVEAQSISGGIVYHAMLNTKVDYRNCVLNPIEGMAFIQNFKSGTFLDLGNAVVEFQDNCDGRVRIAFASGKYFISNGDYIRLDL
jgi:hypothetical protein